MGWANWGVEPRWELSILLFTLQNWNCSNKYNLLISHTKKKKEEKGIDCSISALSRLNCHFSHISMDGRCVLSVLPREQTRLESAVHISNWHQNHLNISVPIVMMSFPLIITKSHRGFHWINSLPVGTSIRGTLFLSIV